MTRYCLLRSLSAALAMMLLAAAACSSNLPPEPPEGSYATRSATLTANGTDDAIELAAVDEEFFTALRAAALFGRLFTEDEYRADSRPVAVIHHSLWEDAFSGSPDVVGTEVEIDGAGRTILGVMPQGFDVPEGVSVWVPRVE